ncbi:MULTISPECIES: hypothetical protein [unclassified Microcoleus]|uniref:hypothetical protein n=1 Tax=unclassified Microcoleus TaxID=2642155 RepID=UPI0025CC41A4|nr:MULTISPECIES: hypothetical protein [unclassified Microcoleus]
MRGLRRGWLELRSANKPIFDRSRFGTCDRAIGLPVLNFVLFLKLGAPNMRQLQQADKIRNFAKLTSGERDEKLESTNPKIRQQPRQPS